MTFSCVTARVSCGREMAPVMFVSSTSCAKKTFRRALGVKGGASQTYVVDTKKMRRVTVVSKRWTLCTKGANGRRMRNDSNEIGAYTVRIILIRKCPIVVAIVTYLCQPSHHQESSAASHPPIWSKWWPNSTPVLSWQR